MGGIAVLQVWAFTFYSNDTLEFIGLKVSKIRLCLFFSFFFRVRPILLIIRFLWCELQCCQRDPTLKDLIDVLYACLLLPGFLIRDLYFGPMFSSHKALSHTAFSAFITLSWCAHHCSMAILGCIKKICCLLWILHGPKLEARLFHYVPWIQASACVCVCACSSLLEQKEDLRKRLSYTSHKLELLQSEFDSTRQYLETELRRAQEELDKFTDKLRR